jgi:DNA-binding transcriptional LysR family regulator
MARPPFRLHHIALLDAVMQSHTLTEAAARMHISQPAVSKQIKQLQQDLGFALFQRQGHKLVPTFEARAMLDQVRRVNGSLGVLNRLATELRDERRGHVQVGAIPAVASHLLPAALAAVAGGDSQVLCTVHSGNTAQVIELVETQQVDLGIALKVKGADQLGFSQLLDWRLECLMPEGHPLLARKLVRPSDLAPYTVVAVELPALDWPDPTIARWDDGLACVRIRVDASGAACRMAQAGLGIAVADSLTVGAFAQPPMARRPLQHRVHTTIGIYLPTLRPRSRTVDALITALVRAAQPLSVRPPTAGRAAARPLTGKRTPPRA